MAGIVDDVLLLLHLWHTGISTRLLMILYTTVALLYLALTEGPPIHALAALT